LRISLLQEDRCNLHLVNCLLSTEVIDKTCDRQKIESGKKIIAISSRIVMITVYGKDGQVCECVGGRRFR
jgi:DNA integrity scanning protein DisA with diadenylate cyclase activity